MSITLFKRVISNTFMMSGEMLHIFKRGLVRLALAVDAHQLAQHGGRHEMHVGEVQQQLAAGVAVRHRRQLLVELIDLVLVQDLGIGEIDDGHVAIGLGHESRHGQDSFDEAESGCLKTGVSPVRPIIASAEGSMQSNGARFG